MLRRTFEIKDAKLELTLEGMSHTGATVELAGALDDLEQEGVMERTGSIVDDFAIERAQSVPANLYSADLVIGILDRMGFNPREVYDYTDDDPPAD